MSSVKQLERAIKQEVVAEMQTNQFIIASEKTGQDIDHRETRCLALQLTLEQAENLRASCFIFGDTLDSQPIEETHEILVSEGFKLYLQNLDGAALYIHDSLGITARVSSNNGLLENICLVCDYEVDVNLVTPESLCGLGAFGEVMSGKFNCTVDATCGLSAKMYVLRHFATDGSLV
jgi:hypothetical protein